MAKEIVEKLREFCAFNEDINWASEKDTWEQLYNDCQRADFLLWVFANTNPDDKRLLSLAKGRCAETAIHLVNDERSVKAIRGAILYGKGKINKNRLSLLFKDVSDAGNERLRKTGRVDYDTYVGECTSYLAGSVKDHYAASAVCLCVMELTPPELRQEKLKQMLSIVKSVLPFETFNL